MFGKKKSVVIPTTKSENLSAAIDNLTSQFTSMIDTLRKTSAEAIITKEVKEKEIAELQTECNNLKAVSDRALTLSDKIANIFG